MMKIDTFINPSTIQGLGLFAAQFVPKGGLVWCYNPLVDMSYTEEQWEKMKNQMSPASFDRFDRYSYTLGGKIIVETDGGQFINHSETDYNLTSEHSEATEVFAVRDIMQGEEILANYLMFCQQEELSFQVGS